MAIAMLLPSVFPKWFTPAGDSVLSGGTLEFYSVGTTTPKSVYADYQQNAPIGNVVTLDGAGDATIFLGAGGYKVILKDSLGAQIDLVDGIFGSGGVGTIPSTANFVFLLNYDELRALSTAVDVAYVAGRTEEGDGGEGWFQRRPGVTAHDDDGVFLASVGGSVEYRRIFDADIDPRWYGVEYGSTDDQKTRVDAMVQGSIETGIPVLVAQRIFLAQNTTILNSAVIHCTEAGHFHATGAVTLTFQAGSRFNGSGVCFSGTLQPSFAVGTIDALRLSWMGGTDSEKWTRALASTAAKFPFLMDVSTSVTSDISVPANLALEPSRGAVLTFAGFANLTISALNFTAPLQFLAFGAESYVGAVSIGSPVVYMEWFGGSASNLGPANAIPFKACCSAKRIDLQARSLDYVVTSANTFTISDFVTWNGNGSKITLNQAITVIGIYLNNILVYGSGSITHSSCIATDSSVIPPLLNGPTVAIKSNLNDVAWLAKAEGSRINRVGKINGNIDTTEVTLTTSVLVSGELWFSGGKVIKTEGVADKSPAFIFADDVSKSSFRNSRFDINSTLFYSANPALEVEIQACENDDWNEGKAIHNGIAIVHLSGCGVKNNPSATSIDGIDILTDSMTHIQANPVPTVLSAATTQWRAPVSLTSDGEYITLGASLALASDMYAISTIRFISITTIWRYGGVIDVTIEYPNGAPPDPSVEIGIAYVQPPMANVAAVGVNALGDGGYFCAEPWTLGEAVPARLPAISTGAKLKATVPVWGGQIDIRAIPETHPTYTVSDIWGDVATSVPDNTNTLIPQFGRLVIYSKSGGAALPSGTKIKAVCRYDLPNEHQYNRFFPDHKPWQHIASHYYKADAFTWQAVRIRTSLTGSYLGQTQLAVPFLFRGGDYNGVQGSLSRREADDFTPVQWNGSTLTVGWS